MMVEGLGFPAISFSPPETPRPQAGTGEEASPSSPPPSFHCGHAGCTKAFRRKEHLNRHVRSHEPTRPHKCYLCNKSFARKDILHRHVLLHNAPPGEGPKRTLLACKTCRRRKIRCDSSFPCSACEASGVRCVRTPSSSQNLLGRLQKQPPGGIQDQLLGQGGIEDEDDDACDDDAEAEDADENGQGDYFGLGWNDEPDHDNNTTHPSPGETQYNQIQPVGTACSPIATRSPNHASQALPTPSITRTNPGTPMVATVTTAPTPAATETPMSTLGETPSSTIISPGPFSPPGSFRSPASFTTAGPFIPPRYLTTPGSRSSSGHGGESHWQSRPGRAATGMSLKENVRDEPTPGSSDLSGIDDLMVWMNQVDLETFFHGLWPLLHQPTLSTETATPSLGT